MTPIADDMRAERMNDQLKM